MTRPSQSETRSALRWRIDPAHDGPRPAETARQEDSIQDTAAWLVAAWSPEAPDDHPVWRHAEQLSEQVRRDHAALLRRETQLQEQIAAFERRVREHPPEGASPTGAAWRELRRQVQQEQRDLHAARQQFQSEQEQARQAQQRLAEELQQREQDLNRREQVLQQLGPDWLDPDELQQQSAREREELRRERAQLEQDQQDWEAHWRRKEEELARQQQQAGQGQRERAEVLEQRRRATWTVHQQTVRLHREMLEMRLAMEQLWSQLTLRSHPDWLVRALNGLRGRIAASFEQESQRLQQRRAELAVLAARVREHQQRLKQQHERLTAWADQRQQELDDQAQALRAWEQDLHRQRRELLRFRALWRGEAGATERDWQAAAT